ncbi:hypothetical protein HK100_005059 [Physocladia obscura]|uniref:Trafficking protein particle complex subunit 12 n=1 Tax=Physocladia obscura TaxID=109957 RepID=A0AAD5SXT4_9FUNG|nr:hypothetical protein HK100_005059 [Physocladia obscura]
METRFSVAGGGRVAANAKKRGDKDGTELVSALSHALSASDIGAEAQTQTQTRTQQTQSTTSIADTQTTFAAASIKITATTSVELESSVSAARPPLSPAFTDAMALARQASPISFPSSRSVSPARGASRLPSNIPTNAPLANPLSKHDDPPKEIQSSSPSPSTSVLQNLPTRRWLNQLHFHDIPPVDPVADIIHKAFPFNSGVRPVRRLLQIHDITSNSQNKDISPSAILSRLVNANSWRAVAMHCASIIPTLEPRRIDDINHWWLMRLIALEKLRFFDILSVEIDVFAPALSVSSSTFNTVSANEWTFEIYPPDTFIFNTVLPENSKPSGSLVSWGLKSFWAREPCLRGLPRESIDRIYTLLLECRINVRRNNSIASATPESQSVPSSPQNEILLWTNRARVLNITLANVLLVELHDFKLAAAIFSRVLNADKNITRGGSGSSFDFDLAAALVRVNLQLGNLVDAKEWIRTIEEEAAAATVQLKSSSDSAIVERETRKRLHIMLMNQALLAVADAGDWDLATTCLQKLLNSVREQKEHKNKFTDEFAQKTEDENVAVIVNNMAVCYLYAGNVGQALSHLETLVVESPAATGKCASVLFNLSTLYDLVDNSLERKRRLLASVVASSAGDDLDVSCLKL